MGANGQYSFWVRIKRLLIEFETVKQGVNQALSLIATGNTGQVVATSAPYYADPTGTNDSTAGLQAAINTAVSNGTPLYLPAGTYKISATLVAAGRLIMSGAAAAILPASQGGLGVNTAASIIQFAGTGLTNVAVLQLPSAFGHNIQKVGLTYASQQTAGSNTYCLQLTGSVAKSLFDEIYMYGGDIGFYTASTFFNNSFRNLWVTGFATNAVYMGASGTNNTAENWYLQNTANPNTTVVAAGNCTISGTTVTFTAPSAISNVNVGTFVNFYGFNNGLAGLSGVITAVATNVYTVALKTSSTATTPTNGGSMQAQGGVAGPALVSTPNFVYDSLDIEQMVFSGSGTQVAAQFYGATTLDLIHFENLAAPNTSNFELIQSYGSLLNIEALELIYTGGKASQNINIVQDMLGYAPGVTNIGPLEIGSVYSTGTTWNVAGANGSTYTRGVFLSCAYVGVTRTAGLGVNTITGYGTANVAPIINGDNGRTTVTLNGATAVTVTNAVVTANSVINFTLKTVGGTVGAYPTIKTVTPGTGFTVVGTAGDTSTYNYNVMG